MCVYLALLISCGFCFGLDCHPFACVLLVCASPCAVGGGFNHFSPFLLRLGLGRCLMHANQIHARWLSTLNLASPLPCRNSLFISMLCPSGTRGGTCWLLCVAPWSGLSVSAAIAPDIC